MEQLTPKEPIQMKMRSIDISAFLRLCGLILVLAAFIAPLTAQTTDYTKWVNPFIGTGGHGHTFPGATMPFGMVQLSPDTRIDNWDGSSGYHYSDDTIYGFSHTHLSGTGIPDYCDILFTPTTADIRALADTRDKSLEYAASKFSHADERAEPGYYSVRLADGIFAEMTASPRVGIHRYTFPNGADKGLIIDLKWRDKVLGASVKVTGPNRLEGFRRSSSWAKDQIIFFVVEFSEPFEVVATERSNNDTSRVYLDFKTGGTQPLTAKVALSHTSAAGAALNLQKDIGRRDTFDSVRGKSKQAWNKVLGKIEVAGGTEAQRTTFYTALYHTMIQPNLASDVDRKYRSINGNVERPLFKNLPMMGVSLASNDLEMMSGYGTYFDDQHYTVFSLWDTFRAAHPLYTIIDQKRTADFINTFIRQYEEGGRLPVWELAGNETDTMIGYHAVSVIADAMAKGIKGFDYDKAYNAAKNSAELDHFGLAAYKRRGYISMEDENESVSKTLEYAYDDWCIMKMGATLFNMRQLVQPKDPKYDQKYFDNLHAEIEHYKRRSGYFENLFDTETGFFRPKQNGGFVKPFAPQEVTFNFTEGNAWQYSFFVPHDVTRLIDLMGGTQKFVTKLDELFTTQTKVSGREQPDITGLIGQYAHGNEPSHHIAYLYNYAGVPSKTQQRVRRIMDEFYKPTPDGLIGNEDCGQMSAWYVLSASGFYPAVPGEERYEIGSPLFKQVTYNLENGKKFIIKAQNVSPANIYIKSARWNGEPQATPYITQYQIMAGGVLDLEMSSTPNDRAFEAVSTSTVYREDSAVPVIDGGGRVFDRSTTVRLSSTSRNVMLHYTLDGSEPNAASLAYTAPFTIDKTTTVKAVVVRAGKVRSMAAEAIFYKKANDWTVSIASKYNRQYTGGGDMGLIDGIRGTTSFASGEWQGYQGQDFVATVDLQKETSVSRLGGGFLQNAGSWIWMPTHIEFETSLDGVNFMKVADIKTDIVPTNMESMVRDYSQTISPVKARYVRVHAYNLGKIPSWHPGAGDEAFIFVDEIIIN